MGIVRTMVRLRDSEKLTIISVSHSTSTSVEADQIVVLDKGTIAERGTYEELVDIDEGIFRGMVLAGRSNDKAEEEKNDRGRSERTDSMSRPPVSSKDLMMDLKRKREMSESMLQLDCS